MPTAAVALRAAIHDALVANGALTALLGGPKIYDEPPKSTHNFSGRLALDESAPA